MGARDSIRSGFPPITSPPQVKIVLKEDRFGLGARGGINCGSEQCTGLDAFQGILGRLNGQNEPQLQLQGNFSEGQMKNVHQESRTGVVRFVSGGFMGETRKDKRTEENMIEPVLFSKGLLLNGDDGVQQVQTQLKCKDKTPNHREPSNPLEHKDSRIQRATGNWTVANESKFLGEESYRCTIPDDQGHHKKKSSLVVDSESLDLCTAGRRVDKVDRKLKRRMKREEQAVLVEKRKTSIDVLAGPFQETQAPIPFAPGPVLRSVPRTEKPLEGRHAVRQRYIRQKKMAIMDSKALNEVGRVSIMREVFHKLT